MRKVIYATETVSHGHSHEFFIFVEQFLKQKIKILLRVAVGVGELKNEPSRELSTGAHNRCCDDVRQIKY